jgi:hypothetical protein
MRVLSFLPDSFHFIPFSSFVVHTPHSSFLLVVFPCIIFIHQNKKKESFSLTLTFLPLPKVEDGVSAVICWETWGEVLVLWRQESLSVWRLYSGSILKKEPKMEGFSFFNSAKVERASVVITRHIFVFVFVI